MSDTPDNLPPPPSYEVAIQGQPPPNVDQKYPPYPTQAPYPQQQYAPPHQYPQQSYPGNPPPGQYPQNPNMPAPGVVGYGPGYPMNTPGYNYNTYSGSVAPNGTPLNAYIGAGFVLTPDQLAQQRKRKQLIMFFVIGVIMIVVFVIIVSSQMG